jgi:hypothetical protein
MHYLNKIAPPLHAEKFAKFYLNVEFYISILYIEVATTAPPPKKLLVLLKNMHEPIFRY